MKKIWVGKRESDILTYNYFDKSVTFWGSNTKGNKAYCTVNRLKDNYGNEFSQFVLNCILEYIEQFGDIEIHFYNNSLAYKLIYLAPYLKQNIVNINSQHSFELTRHKTLSRLWLQNTVDVPSFAYLSNDECTYDNLIKKFPGYTEFVIQKSISGGGNGTYLFTQYNYEEVTKNLSNDTAFLVSPYYNNSVSLSCHVIIDENNVIVFPISKQLLSYEGHKISYCGSSFSDDNVSLSTLAKDTAKKVAYRLQRVGYRGIGGFDFIYTNNQILLIEINPRYQGSSYLINLSLKNNNLPSLFELNSVAFNGTIEDDVIQKISNMKINYETHSYFYNAEQQNKLPIYPNNALVFMDGLHMAEKYSNGVYLYRYLIPTQKNNMI